MEVEGLLNLGRFSDVQKEDGGLVALHRPDIAPLAYEIEINRPLSNSNLAELIKFAAPVPSEIPKRLYGLCNGLRVGANRFSLYGLLPADDLPENICTVGIPEDIQEPNLYGRPRGLDEDCLIIARSSKFECGKRVSFVHYVSVDSKIRVCSITDVGKILAEYATVEEWLIETFEEAMSDRKHY